MTAAGIVFLCLLVLLLAFIAVTYRRAQKNGGHGKEDSDRQGLDQEWYDEEGYDRDGYNREGFDRDGYDKDGYSVTGYNVQGYDRAGYDCDGFDARGFDREGYGRDGFDKTGYDREGYSRQGFDRNGYNRDGFDKYGYDKEGFDREGYNREGYNREGYNQSGFDREGFDRDGRNVYGMSREKVSEFDQKGDTLSRLTAMGFPNCRATWFKTYRFERIEDYCQHVYAAMEFVLDGQEESALTQGAAPLYSWVLCVLELSAKAVPPVICELKETVSARIARFYLMTDNCHKAKTCADEYLASTEAMSKRLQKKLKAGTAPQEVFLQELESMIKKSRLQISERLAARLYEYLMLLLSPEDLLS